MFHVIINHLFMVLPVSKKSANFAAQKVDVSMKLSELKAGERGVIVRVSGHGGFRKRIVEMGFVRGKTVRAIMSAPLADPVEYEVMDYKVSLRRAEAALVEVVSEEEVRRAEHDTCVEDLSPIPYTEEEIGQERQRLQQRMEQLAEERHRSITVALVGNPNCGKTSIFNLASGAHEHTGNYSGVTVDAKEGHLTYQTEGKTYSIKLVDLPGAYSLSAYSPEETYVRRQLIDHTPDVVVNVIDSSNLERNLYLTTQLIDMNLRMVGALNMYDELQARGDQLDHHALGTLLGMPLVPCVGRTGEGVKDLLEMVVRVYENAGTDETLARHIHVNHGRVLEESIDRVKAAFQKNPDIRYKYSTRYLTLRFLENDKATELIVDELPNHDELASLRYAETRRLREELGETPESALTEAKYAFIAGALRETFVPANRSTAPTLTDRLDSIACHRLLGFPIFFLVLAAMFYLTFTLGQYPMDWIDAGIGALTDTLRAGMSPGLLRELVCDGAIAGVGAVIVFLPNILILYLLISLLEDSGYMARAAFIMDRLMHRMGLHGKSFIPMIMGFGCNVPAVMATRTIENPKSRLLTMLVVPLMSCSARIPIYVLLIGAFFPRHAALVMLGLYALGMLMAVLMARLFSRLFMKEVDLPFVMELPPYRIPTLKSVFRHTWEKGRQYLRKMGTIILAASIIVWFLSTFPRPAEASDPSPASAPKSYLQQIGEAAAPVFSPLGFDWRMNVGILAGTSAKELVVSTLGVLYGDGDRTGDEDAAAQDSMLQASVREAMTPASALSYLIFILLYFPCFATIAAIKGESGRWRWALFTAFYTTALAYAVSFAVYSLLC